MQGSNVAFGYRLNERNGALAGNRIKLSPGDAASRTEKGWLETCLDDLWLGLVEVA